ncbi:tRNA1(Val) (adenine(37)-N6)-methyltransferase [Ferruginibacter sp. SUN002]|uniref:tRNA1(Val) (adenine(37)-N6)-methyltransferase n=1 Tax=Ferruginibacter sp. SUN002 TaxID=2937789 RepID=UPI003D367C34
MNSFFQFKQFTIHQDRCAMKVCTDSCLFGAYVASNFQQSTSNILDIGTGTGLLTLMLAQKTDAAIDAVEIDTNAYQQAGENFATTPWKESLQIFNDDITMFVADKKYDLIISNPPFFEDDLRSANAEKNAAKHDTGLTLNKLIETIDRNLSPDGKSAVILPFSRSEDFNQLLQANNFFIEEKVLVRQTPKHDYFRTFFVFGRNKISMIEKTIIIKDGNNNYTNEFKELLKDYYLYL